MCAQNYWKVLSAVCLGVLLFAAPAAAMDTAFSYQARLDAGGSPANGTYDFRFFLYDADVGGSQIGPTLYADDIVVADGLFTVYLNFGAGIFDGTEMWLDVAVRPGGSVDAYTTLSPRQAIVPSPYALHAGTIEVGAVGSAEVLDNSLTASDLATGSVGSSEVADNSLTSNDLATGSVGSSEVADNSLTSNDLATNSVGTAEVANESLTAVDLATGSVTSSEIATGAVTSSDIADGTIIGNDIANGTITYSDTNTGSVQRRVAGTCATGYSMTGISSTGSVNCQKDDWATIFHTGQYSASGSNGSDGNVYWSKPTGIADSVCFLVYDSPRDIDAGGEYAACQILEESTRWRLYANVSSGDDSDVNCGMRCLYWYFD